VTAGRRCLPVAPDRRLEPRRAPPRRPCSESGRVGREQALRATFRAARPLFREARRSGAARCPLPGRASFQAEKLRYAALLRSTGWTAGLRGDAQRSALECAPAAGSAAPGGSTWRGGAGCGAPPGNGAHPCGRRRKARDRRLAPRIRARQAGGRPTARKCSVPARRANSACRWDRGPKPLRREPATAGRDAVCPSAPDQRLDFLEGLGDVGQHLAREEAAAQGLAHQDDQ
jgi:hypothetical protein